MTGIKSYWQDKTAIVDEGAEIGEETRIWHWTHICKRAKVGSHCSLGQNVFVGDDAVIGDNVKIQNNVSIYSKVIIGNNVFCGPSMVFTNVINPRAEVNRKKEYKTTYVEDGVTIGANCTIVCGIRIGIYAFIGAGAVVNKTVKPFALMVGVPARQIGWMSAYGEKIDFGENNDKKWICKITGDIYHLKEGEVIREEKG